MAFPVIETKTSGGATTATQSFDVPLPTGITSGDLLMSLITIINASTISTPTGWTKKFSNLGDSELFAVFTRTSDGTEGSTVNYTTPSSRQWSTITYRISGAENDDIEQSFFINGFTATPNPPSLTASWGSEDNLWFAGTVYPHGGSVTSFSTGFSNGINQVQTLVGMGSADRNEATATKDPDTITLNQSSGKPSSFTVVVRPALPVAEPAIFIGSNF